MAVRAETQIDLTRVDDGSPGSTGPQGPQGWSIVATVERNAFTESQWTTYGTIGHVEGWSGTSSIRNGCRIGDLFLVKGTATDTGRSHELTYRSDTSSGDLHGECINHTYAERGAQGIQGPTGPTGPAGPGISYVTLQVGDDINNCIGKDTIYVTSSTAVCNALDTNYPGHMPSGFPAGELQLEVIWMGDNNYLVQRLTCKNGAVRKVYLRTYSSGTFGEWTEEGVPYGTSSTGASTAAKTASISNWDRASNPYVAIKFTNENTAASPTLNINSTGAASIMTNGSNSAYWEAGSVVNFYWDGTYYQVANTPVYASTVTVGDPNGDHVFIGNGGVQINNGSNKFGEFDQTGLDITDGAGHDIAHLGYGNGNAESGTATTPYYTLGARKSGTAVGNYSLAVGPAGTASSAYSTAFGKETIAGYGLQLVCGEYNDNKNGDLFEVGCGTGSRKNAFEVNKSGDATVLNDMKVTNDIIVKGHDSGVGKFESASNTTTVTLSSSNNTYDVTSIILKKGVWVVVGQIQFPSNSQSYRRIGLSTTSKSGTDMQVSASSSGITVLKVTDIFDITATSSTVYLTARSGQNNQTIGTGNGTIRAVRII